MAQQPKYVLTLEEVLCKLKEDATELARAPVSRVKAGAVGIAESGRFYLGVNVEFEGLCIRHYSIKAEQFLLTNLALNSERRLLKCLLSDGIEPRGFERDAFLSLEPHNNRFALLEPDFAVDNCSNHEHCSHLNCRALTAANKSYAVLSERPAGVALLCEGKVYRGWTIESKCFEPSLAPLQTALVDFMVRGQGKEFDKIVEAVLVERKDAVWSYEKETKKLLDKIAPRCVFNVLHCYTPNES